MAEAVAVVGLISSIVQLVDFSTKVVKRLDDFVTSVGEVPRAFRHIKTELPLITDSLRRIQEQANSGIVDPATVKALNPVIKDCEQLIKRLEAILDKTVPPETATSWYRRKKALLSLWNDKTVEEIAESLGRYVRVLTLHQSAKPHSQPHLQPQQQPNNSECFTLIPFDRNPNFVDREDIFEKIDNAFKVKAGSQPKAALFGLGGIGKSQIALEYCFRRKANDPGCSIFWVYAATVARFEETYKRIATECNLVRENSQLDTTQVVQNWLENRHRGRWLMVVDNVDDADVFFRESTCNNKTLSQCIPRCENGLLLFTTRSRDIAIDLIPPMPPIPIPVLTKSEASCLLRSRLTSEESDSYIVELSEMLEFIPLAITQAAAFMSKRRKTISQYLELYQKSDSARVRMLSHEFSDHGRQDNSMISVAKTWVVSFEHIQRENPRAADLLSLMCFFDRQAIPSALAQGEEENVLDFEDAVAVLCAYSLIESDEAGTNFDMHKLVQLATRLWLIDEKNGKEDYWAFKALKYLARNFPLPPNEPPPSYWTLCASLFPHTQLILAYSFSAKQEEVLLARATLLLSVARYVEHCRGAFVESEKKAEESLRIRESILGERHPDTLKSLFQLAWVYRGLEKGHESVEAYQRCLALRREVLGEDHLETIDTLSELAAALAPIGRLEESEAMQRQALQAFERTLGLEHLDTINCYASLASVLDDQGKYNDAEFIYRRIIDLRTEIQSIESPSIVFDLHNFALCLENQGKDDEAEKLYRRALALETKLFGKTHVETTTTLRNFVTLQAKMTKWDDINQLSGWFLGEMYLKEHHGDPRLLRNLRLLKKYGFQGLDWVPRDEDGSDDRDYEEV